MKVLDSSNSMDAKHWSNYGIVMASHITHFCLLSIRPLYILYFEIEDWGGEVGGHFLTQPFLGFQHFDFVTSTSEFGLLIENFGLVHKFSTVIARALIFHTSLYFDMIFLLVSRYVSLWLGNLGHYWRDLRFLNTSYYMNTYIGWLGLIHKVK